MQILVYDLGGGTFDVTVIQFVEGALDVLGTAGDARLGGEDFTRRLVTECLEDIRATSRQDLSADTRARHLLFEACDAAKKVLSEALDFEIIVPDLSPSLPLYRRRLTRERFLAANKADLDKTIALMQGLLRERSLTPAEITDVVLVGGSSRIPYITAELRKVFPTLAPRTDVNADEAVAIGAAMYARSQVEVVRSQLSNHRGNRASSYC